METVREYPYLGDMSADGESVTTVTDRTRCGFAKHRECSELLHGRRFFLKLKWAVCRSSVRPAIMYGSEA